MVKEVLRIVAAVGGLALITLPLSAHHSFQAEYDGSKVVIIKGVVKKVAWVNPHAYVYVEATDEKGRSPIGPSNPSAPTPWRFVDGRRPP